MRTRLLPCLALLAVVLFARPALAWNKPTHMVIGAIAYDVLKQDSPDDDHACGRVAEAPPGIRHTRQAIGDGAGGGPGPLSLHAAGALAARPLHSVSYYDEQHPQGDKGGNDFYVRVKGGGAVINLHQLWDGRLGNAQTYRATGNLAIELRDRPEFAREMLKELGAPPAINTRNSATTRGARRA